jgi:tRNA-guanine family transglycosylase
MTPTSERARFRVDATCGAARAGLLATPHAVVETPTFMPVGTQGCVKTLTPGEVEATGARIVLGNTYHLWLRPGAEAIDRLGGLHGFSRWPHAMLTDSGGFQAFSLSDLRKTTEDGFSFKSHLDGASKHLSPEEAMRVQGLIGADIAMQLDVCPPGGRRARRSRGRASVRRAGQSAAWRRVARLKPCSGSFRAGVTSSSARPTPPSWQSSTSTGSPWEASASASRSSRCTRRSPRWRHTSIPRGLVT